MSVDSSIVRYKKINRGDFQSISDARDRPKGDVEVTCLNLLEVPDGDACSMSKLLLAESKPRPLPPNCKGNCLEGILIAEV